MPVDHMQDAEAAEQAAWRPFAIRFAERGFGLFRRIEGGYRVHHGACWSADLDDLASVADFGRRAGILRADEVGAG